MTLSPLDATVGVDLGGTKLLLVCGEREARRATGPARLEADVHRFVAGLASAPAAIGIGVPGLVGPDAIVRRPALAARRPATPDCTPSIFFTSP